MPHVLDGIGQTTMIFHIDPNSPKPVYQQIIDQAKYAVASGRLQTGDRLPTIREVAVQTRTNRNTVARAYAELEREGFLHTRTGQGSFISGEAPAHGRERSRRILAERMDELLALAHQFRLDGGELEGLLRERLEHVRLPGGDASDPAPGPESSEGRNKPS